MSKPYKEDKPYYKRMILNNSSLLIQVNEKADYSYTDGKGKRIEQIEPAEVTIYHSPRYWEDDNFQLHLKNRQQLKDYIKTLQDFEEKHGDLLDMVQGEYKKQ